MSLSRARRQNKSEPHTLEIPMGEPPPSSPVSTTKQKTPRSKKVLNAAGKPLRSVSRRIFKSQQQHRSAPLENYEALSGSGRPSHLRNGPHRNSPQRSLRDTSNRSIGTTEAEENEDFLISSRGLVGNTPQHYHHHHQSSSLSAPLSAVYAFEKALRQVWLVTAAYIIGVYHPSYVSLASKLVEYAVVAWVTCVVIVIVQTWQLKQQQQQQQEEAVVLGGVVGERQPLLAETTRRGSIDEVMTEEDLEAAAAITEEAPSDEILLRQSSSASLAGEPVAPPQQVHPALEPYFVMDCVTGQRCMPNSSTPHSLDTEYFTGKMMVLIRTPDVDDPRADKGLSENMAVADYLSDKQRRFEFQFQLKLKKIPTGAVYFACELEDDIKMSMIQRAFVGAAMAFIKTTNNSFHYSISGSGVMYQPDGKYEKPHMAFPVEGSMDRVVATPPGQPLPVLGGRIDEDAESIKRRKKGGLIDWNFDDTYTFALWSAYVDMLDWRCINLPGVRPFALTNVIGTQPVLLSLYEIPHDKRNEKHYRKDLSTIVELEMSNSENSGAGPMAIEWVSCYRDAAGATIIIEDENEEIDEDDDFVLYEEESDKDATTVAELGEGLYIRSGDSVTLREAIVDNDDSTNQSGSPYVTIGGGMAVLQDRSAATIIIEKAGKSRVTNGSSAGSKLIRTGDTVIFKILTRSNKSDDQQMKYLTLHRGWWLKWVATPPKKNGLFTIHTHETEFSDSGSDIQTEEPQSSYLTIGGAFWLQHKRWKKFLVGVAAEGSATFGGRILGLYKPKSLTRPPAEDAVYNSDDESQDVYQPESSDFCNSDLMRPIHFRAYDCLTVSSSSYLNSKTSSEDRPDEDTVRGEKPQLVFSVDKYKIDVPVWIEMMNRRERVRQLGFAVRVLPPDWPNDNEAFVRLRTGRDLNQIMRIGLQWRNGSPSRRSGSAFNQVPKSPGNDSLTSHTSDGLALNTPPPPKSARKVSSSKVDVAKLSMQSFDEELDDFSDDDEWDLDSADSEVDLVELLEDDDAAMPGESQDDKAHVRRLKKIGKIAKATAKSVKTKTTSTGKTVVKRSVRVGKGTVNAGKAITTRIAPIRPKKPPSIEPKSAKARSRRRRERDLHAAVTRSMKRIERRDSHLLSEGTVAGELSAPEQSMLIVSKMLSNMSSLPMSSPFCARFSALLALQVDKYSDLDSTFLQGGPLEIGVVLKTIKDKVLSECLVARCLWESHWREELCVVFDHGVAFFAPLTRSPCLELSFLDVDSVRCLEAGPRSPLPGFPMLVIETAWLCHYIAFTNEDSRQAFHEKIRDAMTRFEQQSISASSHQKELWNVRFWQNSIESSLSSGRGKWAEVNSGNKSKRRTIMNNRKMLFDVDTDIVDLNEFVQDLLSTCLSFSLDSLEQHPEALVKFLDGTSRLRAVSFDGLDLASSSALCLFVNLYHCLLQHALLLSVDGNLHKRSCGHFMRTSCYEIAGDVFSLAEISSCIIRGGLSRPNVPKAPYVEAPKKSNAYYLYALQNVGPIIHFVLNTGDDSCPSEVLVFNEQRVDLQLVLAAEEFLRKNVLVDESRRIIYVPKVCEAYRNDFAGDSAGAATICLQYCLRFISGAQREKIEETMRLQDPAPTIKFLSTSELYHSSLKIAAIDASPVSDE